MDEFLANAGQLLESARAAGGAEGTGGAQGGMPLAILIGQDGSIRAVSGSDWPLESLAREHGARMAYRISRSGRTVRVEGRHGMRRCLLEAEAPAHGAQQRAGGRNPAYCTSLLRISFT